MISVRNKRDIQLSNNYRLSHYSAEKKSCNFLATLDSFAINQLTYSHKILENDVCRGQQE